MLEKILIGGYTKRASKGIYALTLDTEKKELGNKTLFAEVQGPTYFAVDEQKHLFSVATKDGLGSIASFDYEKEGLAVAINAVSKTGSSPCYVGVDVQRNLVFAANYHLSEITVYKNENGKLVLVDTVKHEGSGPHPNQDQARIHFADLTPERRLVACDLGTDGVYTYDVSDEGKLTEVAIYQATPGAGARHITFHPNGKFAYLFGELNSTIEVLNYDQEKGTFTKIQVLSTLPPAFTEFNGGAAIRITSDGKFVYASNRGHNSLAIFSVDTPTNTLTLKGHQSVEGAFPRDFNFSKDETFVIVANQETDNVTLFERCKDSGELTLLQKDIAVPEGTCVLSLG